MLVTDTDRTRRVLHLFEQLLDAPLEVVTESLSGEPDAIAVEVRTLLDVDREGVTLDRLEVTGLLVDPVPAGDQVRNSPEGFALHECIGRGSMGEVYRATQRVPRREVALKFVDGDGVDEAQALADASHPVIPAVFLVGRVGTEHFVAMELVRGRPLRGWSAEATDDERLTLLEQLCRGVDDLHRAGLLHRDLKPANILVDASGPRLVDFGLAVDVGTAESELAGTPRYMAPEVLRKEPASVRSDVFSLTCIVLEVLTGAYAMPPGPTPSRQRAAREEWTGPALDGMVASVVARGLAVADARYPSALELAEDLARVREGAVPVAHRATLRERLARIRGRHGRSVGIAVVALSVLGALASWSSVRQAYVDRAASARLAVLEAQLEPERAVEQLTAFLELGPIAGTSAAERARLMRAEEARARGDHALEQEDLAIVFADRGPGRPEAAARLAESFATKGRWTSLEAVWPSVVDDARREGFARLASVGLRDWWAPDRELPPMIQHLREARRTPWRAEHVWSSEDGWVGFLPDVGLSVGDDTEVVELGWRLSWLGRRPLVVDVDGFALVVDRGGGAITLFRATSSGLETVAETTIDGKPWSAVAHDFDGDGTPTLLVGTAAHPRSLWAMEPPTWDPWLVDAGIERTDADVQRLVVDDLDGDGVVELVVHLGPWTAHDLRVYRVGAGTTLTLLARERLGGLGHVVVFALPDGRRRIAVVKDDTYPNPLLFGHAAPTGGPKGIYVYAFDTGRLVLESQIPLPDLELPWQGAFAADLDGDGDMDLITANGDGMVLVELDEDAELQDVHRVRGLRAVGTMNTDGDPADEVLVTVDGTTDVWVLGDGDERLPKLNAAGSGRSELEQMGLFGAAANRHSTWASLASDPVLAARDHSESARLHELEQDFGASLTSLSASLALDPTPAVYEQKAALLERLARYDEMVDLPEAHRRGPVVATHALSFADALPELEWRVPTALEHRPGEGLRILASPGDGTLARLPVTVTGSVIGIEVELDVLSAEAGADLRIGLRRADGPLLGANVEPWGGAEQVARKLGCLAGETSRHLGRHEPLRRSGEGVSRVHTRTVLDRDTLVCEAELGDERLFVRRSSPLRIARGEQLELAIWTSGRHTAAQIEAVLKRLVLLGLEPADPPLAGGRAIVERQYRQGLETAEDPITRLELLGHLARISEARALWAEVGSELTVAALLPAVRRQPTFWLDLLRSEAPDRVPRLVAEGWLIAYASGDNRATRATVERVWVDGLPVVEPAVARLLLRHGQRLVDVGEHERARQVFDRLRREGPLDVRAEATLGLATAEVGSGNREAAGAACTAAAELYDRPFFFADRVQATPALRDLCGDVDDGPDREEGR